MDDYKKNWFYKMCVKRFALDFVLIFVGLVLAICGILIFTRIISIYIIMLLLLGIGIMIKGASSVFIKLPKIKNQLKDLTFDEINDLGSAPPDKMYYETFYCTDKFLCAPNAYALIRYRNIDNVTASVVTQGGRQAGMFITVEQLVGAPVKINVKGWGTFQKEADEFLTMLALKKAEDKY